MANKTRQYGKLGLDRGIVVHACVFTAGGSLEQLQVSGSVTPGLHRETPLKTVERYCFCLRIDLINFSCPTWFPLNYVHKVVQFQVPLTPHPGSSDLHGMTHFEIRTSPFHNFRQLVSDAHPNRLIARSQI